MKKYLIILLLVLPFSVGAVTIENPLKYDTFHELLNAIVDFVFYLGVFGLAPLMIIIAGFFFVTAQGEPEKIKKARDMVLWTMIGVIILFMAKGIINLLMQILGTGSA